MTAYNSTKLRSDVVKILKKNDKPLKAYDILAELHKVRPNAKPPTVYRVLHYLVSKNIVHEIAHQRSYVLCQCEHQQSTSLLLICQSCQQVIEHDSQELSGIIKPLTGEHDFQSTAPTIELLGLCHQCQ